MVASYRQHLNFHTIMCKRGKTSGACELSRHSYKLLVIVKQMTCMRPGTGQNVSCIVSDFPQYLGLPFFIQRCGSLIGNDTEIQLECQLTCHYTILSCIITAAHALIWYYPKSAALYAIAFYKCVHYQPGSYHTVSVVRFRVQCGFYSV